MGGMTPATRCEHPSVPGADLGPDHPSAVVVCPLAERSSQVVIGQERVERVGERRG